MFKFSSFYECHLHWAHIGLIGYQPQPHQPLDELVGPRPCHLNNCKADHCHTGPLWITMDHYGIRTVTWAGHHHRNGLSRLSRPRFGTNEDANLQVRNSIDLQRITSRLATAAQDIWHCLPRYLVRQRLQGFKEHSHTSAATGFTNSRPGRLQEAFRIVHEVRTDPSNL